MTSKYKRFKRCLTMGIVKGWKGFLWMLKILVPISFITAVLAWSEWLNQFDFILSPVMNVIGLPSMAALPLIAGLLTGPYGAIAAMAPLPLSIDQMTLVAIFLLISHNLIQEGVIQHESGLPFIPATLVRLLASVLMVMAASWVMGPETAESALSNHAVTNREPLITMLMAWAVTTLSLSAKILVIIMALMLILEVLKQYDLMARIIDVISPCLKALGLAKETGFLWLTAVVFGLTYGAAVIVQEVKEGRLSEEALKRLQLSIGINHSMIEDPALFLSLGLGLFWLCVPRLIAAILVVQLFILYRRVTS